MASEKWKDNPREDEKNAFLFILEKIGSEISTAGRDRGAIIQAATPRRNECIENQSTMPDCIPYATTIAGQTVGNVLSMEDQELKRHIMGRATQGQVPSMWVYEPLMTAHFVEADVHGDLSMIQQRTVVPQKVVKQPQNLKAILFQARTEMGTEGWQFGRNALVYKHCFQSFLKLAAVVAKGSHGAFGISLSLRKDTMFIKRYLHSLHGVCPWVLANYTRTQPSPYQQWAAMSTPTVDFKPSTAFAGILCYYLTANQLISLNKSGVLDSIYNGLRSEVYQRTERLQNSSCFRSLSLETRGRKMFPSFTKNAISVAGFFLKRQPHLVRVAKAVGRSIIKTLRSPAFLVRMLILFLGLGMTVLSAGSGLVIALIVPSILAALHAVMYGGGLTGRYRRSLEY